MTLMLLDKIAVERRAQFTLTDEEMRYLAHQTLNEIAFGMATAYMKKYGEELLAEMGEAKDELRAEVTKLAAEKMAERLTLNIEPPKP